MYLILYIFASLKGLQFPQSVLDFLNEHLLCTNPISDIIMVIANNYQCTYDAVQFLLPIAINCKLNNDE